MTALFFIVYALITFTFGYHIFTSQRFQEKAKENMKTIREKAGFTPDEALFALPASLVMWYGVFSFFYFAIVFALA